MRILTAEAMNEVDRRAIEEHGLAGATLMARAAESVAAAILERYADARSVAIFCGPGNNGGDGLVVGRLLADRGLRVGLVLAAGERGLSADAERELAAARQAGLEPHRFDLVGGSPAEVLGAVGEPDLVVDALFGTGLKRPLEGAVAELVEAMNRLGAPRVAVDLPSGLFGGSAQLPGPSVKADLTVTFAVPKIAHVFPPAAERVGEWVVGDLGIPSELIEDAAGDLELLAPSSLAGALRRRPRAAHKGDFGHLLVVAGSTGRSGAAVLAARAAIRSGAGLVTLAVPASLVSTVEAASLESMTLPLPETPGGALAAAATEVVLEALESRSALALGPGLGTEPETVAAVCEIVGGAGLPAVVDADGINAFAEASERLAGAAAARILTPHHKELSRLLGVPVGEIAADRPAAARAAAQATRSTLVLKGKPTLVAAAEGRIGVNPTGNPGMATGGTGDVLTGMIGGLMAQGLGPNPAARLGVFLHGLAGDLAAGDFGEVSMSAGDLLERLPAAFQSLGVE